MGSHRPLFVGIGHKKQHGKDTLAAMLRARLALRDIVSEVTWFAKPLKDLAIATYGLTHEQCWGSDEDKNTLTSVTWSDLGFLPSGHGGFLSARRVLQSLGVQMRERFPGIWANAPFKKSWASDTQVVVIPDTRFEDEALNFKEHGGIVVRVTRDRMPVDNHPSETALDTFDGWDFDIQNRTDKLALHAEACELAEHIRDLLGGNTQ